MCELTFQPRLILNMYDNYHALIYDKQKSIKFKIPHDSCIYLIYCIGNRVTVIKEESLDDIVVKEESFDLEDELPLSTDATVMDQQFSKGSKRKNSKKCRKEDANKKNNKKKKIAKANVKVFEKSKTETQPKILIEETNNSNSTPLSSKKAPGQ